jgi:hypothetical protein
LSADPLKPTTSLLMKLGSAVVHAEEALSVMRNEFDLAAFMVLLTDPEVRQWMEQMNEMALLPVKR